MAVYFILVYQSHCMTQFSIIGPFLVFGMEHANLVILEPQKASTERKKENAK